MTVSYSKLRPGTSAAAFARSRSSAVVLVLFVVGSLLLADAALAESAMKVEVQFFDVDKADGTQRARLTFAKQKLRVDQFAKNDATTPQTLIYRGDRDVIYSLSARDQRYIQVDRKLLTSVGRRLQAARREMEAMLRRLPEDQRRSSERLIGLDAREEDGRERGALQVTDLNATRILVGHKCRVVALSRGTTQVAEACVVPWSRLGIGPKDLDVFRQLANFQREIMGAGGLTPLEVVPDQPLDLLVQLDGFPLEFNRRVKGRTVSAIRVTSLERVGADPQLFDVPADYALRPGFEYFAGKSKDAAPKGANSGAGAAVPAAPHPAP